MSNHEIKLCRAKNGKGIYLKCRTPPKDATMLSFDPSGVIFRLLLHTSRAEPFSGLPRRKRR